MGNKMRPFTFILILLFVSGCNSNESSVSDSDSGTGGTSDSDSDTDIDAGSDSDSDTDTDADTDTDTNVEKVEEFDVPYTPPKDGDAAMSLLDIYYVPDGKPQHLIAIVHGGSWVGGDKINFQTTEAMIPWFLDRGFVVAVLNFRLASPPGSPRETTYAHQATDVAFALKWLKDNGATYGVTKPGALLLGYSSGAHLVALLAADEQYLKLVGLSHGHLVGAISFDVHAYDVPYALELMQGSELEGNIPLIEFLFGETEAEQRVGSPSTYAEQASVPPSLLVSVEPSAQEGSHGFIASHATQRYGELLQASGHQATFVHYDGETHSSLVMDFGTTGDEPTKDVSAFLDGLSL
jgi:acetyl esterase/lipase